MSWDYAEMSKAAKAAGGPEKYADALVQSGRQEMLPFVLLAAGGTFLVTKFGPKITGFIKNKWVSKQEAAEARKAIIDGINEYDESQINDDEDDQTE